MAGKIIIHTDGGSQGIQVRRSYSLAPQTPLGFWRSLRSLFSYTREPALAVSPDALSGSWISIKI